MRKAKPIRYCAVTGEVHCKCEGEKEGIPAIKVNMRETMRKLFTDHAVFTKFVLQAIVDAHPGVTSLLTRLKQNQTDIGDQLKPIIGVKLATKLSDLLLEHITLAGEVITAASDDLADKTTLESAITKLMENSGRVAEFLTSLNPVKLPAKETHEMFDMHNQFVIDMTLARIAGNWEKEIVLYDAYYNEILSMSDAINDAL